MQVEKTRGWNPPPDVEPGGRAAWLRRGSGAARPGARTIRVSAPGVRSGRAQEAVD